MGEQLGWQLSGNAPEAYERYIIPALFNEWACDLVETAAVQTGERVLDLACGTGVVARTVAPRVGKAGQVVGIDVNEGMLGMARTVPPPSGAEMTWQQGDAASLPLPSAAFDVVLCQQGLQYFQQRAAALMEMKRVLVPGGRIALSVWRPIERQPFFMVVVDVIESHLNASVGDLQRAAFTLGDADELRGLIMTAGFRTLSLRLVVRHVPGYPGETTVLYRRYWSGCADGVPCRCGSDIASHPFASTDRLPIPLRRHEQTNHAPHRDAHGGATPGRATH
jgi:ubiquinone/menaquinone biosynthesis C-methylase UbiE